MLHKIIHPSVHEHDSPQLKMSTSFDSYYSIPFSRKSPWRRHQGCSYDSKVELLNTFTHRNTLLQNNGVVNFDDFYLRRCRRWSFNLRLVSSCFYLSRWHFCSTQVPAL
ncbi:hypothetical protein CDAR_243721 [Caerostris darwini]|uniref:Uncharacterized protein n=1 Tax=Caerostris darwini TaxID=1538125 RepID=A0AAV4VCX8_9ARAC|nr:hypothetical protein CDAR_243721 [Caerostris darwini]